MSQKIQKSNTDSDAKHVSPQPSKGSLESETPEEHTKSKVTPLTQPGNEVQVTHQNSEDENSIAPVNIDETSKTLLASVSKPVPQGNHKRFHTVMTALKSKKQTLKVQEKTDQKFNKKKDNPIAKMAGKLFNKFGVTYSFTALFKNQSDLDKAVDDYTRRLSSEADLKKVELLKNMVEKLKTKNLAVPPLTLEMFNALPEIQRMKKLMDFFEERMQTQKKDNSFKKLFRRSDYFDKLLGEYKQFLNDQAMESESMVKLLASIRESELNLPKVSKFTFSKKANKEREKLLMNVIETKLKGTIRGTKILKKIEQVNVIPIFPESYIS